MSGAQARPGLGAARRRGGDGGVRRTGRRSPGPAKSTDYLAARAPLPRHRRGDRRPGGGVPAAPRGPRRGARPRLRPWRSAGSARRAWDPGARRRLLGRDGRGVPRARDSRRRREISSRRWRGCRRGHASAVSSRSTSSSTCRPPRSTGWCGWPGAALKPDGVLILETPNPLSIVVAARNFWLDPTHRRPVHPETPAADLRARRLRPDRAGRPAAVPGRASDCPRSSSRGWTVNSTCSRTRSTRCATGSTTCSTDTRTTR